MGKKQFHVRRRRKGERGAVRGVRQLALRLREAIRADASARWQEQHNTGNVLLFASRTQHAEEPSLGGEDLLTERTAVHVNAGPRRLNRALLTASELRGTPDGVYVRTSGRVIARRVPASARHLMWVSLEDQTGISNVAIPAALQDRERVHLEAGIYLEIEGRLRNSKGTLHIEASRIESPTLGTSRQSDRSL